MHMTDRATQPPPRVLLVHGIWNARHWLAPFAIRLRREGLAPELFGYDSIMRDPAHAGDRLIAHLRHKLVELLVGHSLGGLLIVELLAQAPVLRLRRVVLLGTPCVDSHCARELAGVAGLPALLGRSIMEWLSRAPGATALPRSARQVGVLAGTRSVGLGRIVPGLPRPNDGVVALAETRLPGAADFIALPVAHSGMLASRRCAVQIASFLESGRFLHDQAI